MDVENTSCRRKGGFRACTFIFVLGALENMGYIANMASMVIYFWFVMHFELATAATTLTNFMGSVFLLSLVGAFVADTYLNRLYTTLVFGGLEVVGLAMVTVQAYSKDLQPEACGKATCIEGGKALMLYVSLTLLALGAGGSRGAIPALGGDQFDHKEQKAGALASYYNWNLLCSTAGAMVGVTLIVWISMNKAWYWGFFISTVATLIGYTVLGLGKSYFRIQPPGSSRSPLVKIAQVIVVAFRNRNFSVPNSTDRFYEIDDAVRDSSEERIQHSNQFRFLDKAAILPRDMAPQEWKVCTVTQVEEVKVLIRMMPIILSTIIMNTCMAQLQTFSVQQGISMDAHLGTKTVPAPSIPVIPLIFLSILIPLYEFVAVPFARKITGRPSGITQLQRVGVGLVLAIISMTVAGVIEVYRKDQATKNPPKIISIFWLSFQYGIFGIADMFTVVGLMEFFYQEAPSGMRSLSTSFTWLSLAFGYFLSTIFVNVINSITKSISPSKQGWLYGNDLNANNLQLFYWFLAVLSSINFVIYLYLSSWYKYKHDATESETETDTDSRENVEMIQYYK